MLRKTFFILCFIIPVFYLPSWAMDETKSVLDVFFIRHAETIGNATGDYSNNRGEIITEKGHREIIELIKKLDKYSYNHVLVSPAHRTRMTIIPYLKKYHRQAEIWPEIAECCWQIEEQIPKDCSKANGKKITIAPQNKSLFRFRDKNSDRFYKTNSYGQGLCQIEDAFNLLKKKFWLSGKKIVLINHGNLGRMLIIRLLGHYPAPGFYPENARITHLRQTKDGKFHLIRLNDKEVKYSN